MAANGLKPDPQAGRKPTPLIYIQQKLERVLHNQSGPASPYRTEVESIVDTLDALNRGVGGLRLRRLGEHDFD